MKNFSPGKLVQMSCDQAEELQEMQTGASLIAVERPKLTSAVVVWDRIASASGNRLCVGRSKKLRSKGHEMQDRQATKSNQ